VPEIFQLLAENFQSDEDIGKLFNLARNAAGQVGGTGQVRWSAEQDEAIQPGTNVKQNTS
jgi:hypothetical protein